MAEVHILISEVFSGTDDSGLRFYDVNVSIDDGEPALRRVVSPWQENDEQELDWYLEVYASASGSPFERSRAEKCHKAIQRYAVKLYEQLLPKDHLRYEDRNIVIDVQAASFRTGFLDLHWETLEQSPLRRQVDSTSVHIRRCFRPCGLVARVEIPTAVLNILLITARPKQEDIDYLLVSQRLVAAVVKAGGGQPLVNIDIVRPGTWQALVKKLDVAEQDFGHGYYQIVHFDVHGLRIDDGARRGTYLTLLDKTGTTAVYKRAEDIAERLQKHGVKGVVLNSCRSSSTGQIDYSSLPASFIEKGLSMVIGMKANISSGAVERFASSFYSAFLSEKRPWHVAVSCARTAMAIDNRRNARFGHIVESDDWLVPTLYCSQDVRFVAPSSTTETSPWSFAGMIRALRPVEQLVDRMRMVFNDPDVNIPELLGRDAMILELENTLLFPFQRPDGKPIWRKHVHLHGLAGSGKTAIMKYLAWWWKLTHMVDNSIYIDCNELATWSTKEFIELAYERLHGDSSKDSLNIDDLARTLSSGRNLLVVDHLEVLSMEPNALSDIEKAELTQFLGRAAGGTSYVFTISRNSTEPWLIVPRGRLYPFKVGNLTSPAALKMAISNIVGFDHDGEELEALGSLLDRQDHMPAGVLSIVALLKNNKMTPKELLLLLTSTTSQALKLNDHQSKLEKEIYLILSLFARNAVVNTTTLNSGFEVLLSLAAFRRRVPPDFLAYWFYRRCYQHDDQGFIQLLGIDAAADIMVAKNSHNMVKYVSHTDADDFDRLWTNMIGGLQTIGVIWLERLEMPGGHIEEYWHLHPLFTMTLQLWVANGDFFNKKLGQPCIGRINALALATYYNQRMLDLADSDAALAAFSIQRVLFELDSIYEATYAWLDTWMAKGIQSFILVKLTQMFNLNRLQKRDYRLVLDILLRATTYYEAMQHELQGTREIGELALENFCVSASQLQNSAFSVNDWAKVRDYNSRVLGMLEKSPNTVKTSYYAQATYSQARMVAAFEVKSREAYKRAADMFRENLALPDIEDSVLSRRIGNAKIRFMNYLGLLQCEMSREDAHIRELEILHAKVKLGVMEYVRLSRTADNHHGWTEDDQLLLRAVDTVAEGINLRRLAEAETSPEEIVDVFTDLLKKQVAGHKEKQGSFVTLYTVLSSKDNWRSKDSRAASILNGYEMAVRDNADTSTLSTYLIEITLIHIKDGNYEAALEGHEQWRKLVKTANSPGDILMRAYEHYAYALCYEGLGQRDAARKHIQLALKLTTGQGVDKLRLGCLEVHAMIEAEDGHYRPALTSICEAGLLAYDQTKDANYDEHGLLLKLGFRIFMHACAGSQDDRAELEEHIKNLAKQARGELPPGRLPTSGVWDTRERPSELIKFLMGIVGMRRGANVMRAYSQGEIFDEHAEVRWKYVENLCFQYFEDEHSAATSTTTNPNVAVDPDISHAAETVVPILTQLVGNTRDERKRTVFWHICGGTRPESDKLPPNITALLEELDEVDSGGHLDVIRSLASDISIEAFDDRGTTVVMNALAQGANKAAALLVELGADINAVDFRTDSPLHHAVQAQDVARVELCLRLGSRLEQKNALGLTPLAVAVQKDDYDICHVLIHHGANVLARDNVGRTCVLLSAMARQYENFALAFETLAPFGRDLCRRILLDHGFSHENYINLFLKNAEDIDHDKLAFFESIFQLPQDLEVANQAGLSPFHGAVMNSGCNVELIKALFVDSQANADLRDDSLFGMTPMHLLFARDDPIATLQIMNGDPDLETLHGGLKAVALIAMGGLEMEVGEHKISLPEKRSLQLKIATAWRKSCDLLLYNNLERKGLELTVDLKRQLAFEDEVSEYLKQGGMDQFPMQAAMFEMGFEQAKTHEDLMYRDPAIGRVVSRMAAKVKKFEELLTRDVRDEDTDAFLQLRTQLAWKGNTDLLPQIYHIDRHGRCRYVQPAAEREDEIYRVWVVDGDGNHRGVMGTVDWDNEE